MLNNFEYLPKKNEFHEGDVKNLAITVNQKEDMSKMYPKTEINSVSNADMLSQSFGGGEPQVIENLKKETEPVQVTSIPKIENSFNMEAYPVDLNVNQPIVDPFNNFQETTMNMPNTSSINSDIEKDNRPVIEPINQNKEEDNTFKVSSAPNIFDQPFEISQEEINKPIENNNSEKNPNLSDNIFGQPNLINPISDANISGDNINDDIILAQITIEESNVKHYEALAENSKKKIEILKRQVKNKNEEVNLENTASNLFNNNGVLDDDKVLGETPMPTLRAA